MRRTAGLSFAALALLFAIGCPIGPAAAQGGGEGLSPTLAAIKARHTRAPRLPRELAAVLVP